MITIATFNIKNNYNDYDKRKSLKIYNLIKKKNIDILCMQEVFSKCKMDLCEIIKNTDYNMYGKYRYRMKIFDHINESVSIITKLNVLEHATFHLPYLPSTLKRVITRVVVDTDEFGKIVILNTHLDFMFDIAKKRQLKRILKIVKCEQYPTIVTGDFNLKNNNNVFNNFVDEMSNLGLKRVVINEKTLKQSRYRRAIDHIFIPNNFKLIKTEVIKDLDISDHYPVLIQIEK